MCLFSPLPPDDIERHGGVDYACAYVTMLVLFMLSGVGLS